MTRLQSIFFTTPVVGFVLFGFFGAFTPSNVFAQSDIDNVISADFRGKIIYEGFIEGTMTTPTRGSRRFIIGGLLDSALNKNIKNVRGSTYLEIEYEGSRVRGSYRTEGTLSGRGTLTGTRSGSTCNIIYSDGVRATTICTKTSFTARMAYNDQSGREYKTYSEANQTSIIDYVERDRISALAAQSERSAALAAAAKYAALPNAGAVLTKKLDGFVQIDSQGWAFNRYNPGTMRDVKILDGAVKSGNYVMRGDYTYNGTSSGWVMAKIVAGKLECIEFWDAAIGCRALRTPEQGQAMRDAFFGAATGSGSGNPGQPRMCPDGGKGPDGIPIYVPCN